MDSTAHYEFNNNILLGGLSGNGLQRSSLLSLRGRFTLAGGRDVLLVADSLLSYLSVCFTALCVGTGDCIVVTVVCTVALTLVAQSSHVKLHTEHIDNPPPPLPIPSTSSVFSLSLQMTRLCDRFTAATPSLRQREANPLLKANPPGR